MKFALPFCLATAAFAQSQNSAPVEMELMTYPEIYSAIHQQGKTTAIVYNGGTEQRGPHAVLSGHTIMARAVAAEIARKLGNALVAPVLPFSPAGGHLNPKWPGTVNLPAEIYVAVNKSVVESMVVNGFKNIVLIGDHGGGQAELKALAAKLDSIHGPKGVHVFYSGAAYYKSRADFDAWSKANHLPLSEHGGIPETSVLLYLGGDRYIRKDKMVAGDLVLPPGEKRDPKAPRVNNGVIGDPRLSTAEIGKRLFDMRVEDAVQEIRKMIPAAR
jgi:creatinine amidohydrolase